MDDLSQGMIVMNGTTAQPQLFPDLDQRLLPGAAPVPLPVPGGSRDPEPPCVASSATSREAGYKKRSTAATDREKVFAFIEFRGEQGATCDEIEARFDMSHQSASARCWELCGGNERNRHPVRIVKSELRRKTRTGNAACVYVAVKTTSEATA